MAIMMDMAKKVRLWVPSYAAPTGKRRECVCVEESRGQECTDSEGEQRATPILTY